MSKVSNALRAGLMALALLTAGGGYVVAEHEKAAA